MGTKNSDAMLTRLEGEIEERSTYIEGIIRSAQDANRDLTDSEHEMMADAKKNSEEGEKFLADNGKKPGVKTTASGLQYQAVSEGTGPKPKATDYVKVKYKGTFLDGKEFDSTEAHGGEPVVFPVAGVIPGWSEGVQLMPVGSKYKFWVPAKLAYGDQVPPGGKMQPNATLVFDVELVSIEKAPPKGAPQQQAPQQ